MSFSLMEIKNASIKFAFDGSALTEYGDNIDSVKVATTYTVNTWSPVSGNGQSKVSAPKDQLQINVGDSLLATDLWLLLRENHGEVATVEVTPTGGGSGKISGSVTIVAPGSIGGAEGAVNSSTVNLDFNGAAIIVPATAIP